MTCRPFGTPYYVGLDQMPPPWLSGSGAEDVVLFHHLRLDPSSGASAGVPPPSPSRYSLVSQQQLKHIRAARSF